MSADFVAANMRNWNERVADHLVAYGADAFADDPSAVWADTEAELLRPFMPDGSFVGVQMVHLQCHIGLDTISFARRGAQIVGTDLSGEAIAAAAALAGGSRSSVRRRVHLGRCPGLARRPRFVGGERPPPASSRGRLPGL